MKRLIEKTKRFQKNFKELPIHVQNKFKSIVPLFLEDPFVWHLKTHQLQGELEGLYSSSITDNYRFITIIDLENHKITFVNIGTHSIYR